MTMIRHSAFIGLLLGFTVLLGISTWADWQASIFNNPDSEDGYEPLFTPGEYTAPDITAWLFPANAQVALAEQAATADQLSQAKQHAYTALCSNPASGRAAAMLFDLYAHPNVYKLPELPADTESESEAITTSPPTTDVTAAAIEESPPEFTALTPTERALTDRLARISLSLNRTDPSTLYSLAQYWWVQGDQAQSIHLWADLLVNNRNLGVEAFPVFHAAMNTPSLTTIFQQYIESPPLWWGAFFQYLLEQEPNKEKIYSYYLKRLQSRHPPDATERDSYVNHLINQKRWSDAYEIWQGSSITHTHTSPSLYDGGFEDNSQQHTPFAWVIHSTPEAKIKLERGSGVSDKQALHITFQGTKSILFQHVAQTRTWPSGKYDLQGHYQLVQLKTDSGLRWRVHCIDDQASVLGESGVFTGNTNGWQTFQMTFSVPPACPAQLLRLESDSSYAHRNVFKGEIWFDKLSLQPKQR